MGGLLVDRRAQPALLGVDPLELRRHPLADLLPGRPLGRQLAVDGVEALLPLEALAGQGLVRAAEGLEIDLPAGDLAVRGGQISALAGEVVVGGGELAAGGP